VGFDSGGGGFSGSIEGIDGASGGLKTLQFALCGYSHLDEAVAVQKYGIASKRLKTQHTML
jgi:hypothetical protein